MADTKPKHAVFSVLRILWQDMNGEAAYARYLRHWQMHHADQGQPLSRKAFFAAETRRKWNGVRRCC
ncbi:CstA-like transporter-associated (seleno)protein [Methylomonas sp. 2BW1-5-20]|uniref:CstA-like transporter-associated (seleno)protein n=1 Tax=Methylomonas sp. 2BW1-5-20 TaxID=3376686 RepID=UPI00405244E2